jgi:hypothetical protein
MTISVNQVNSLGDLRDATAFDLSWVTPNGLVRITVGHADAAAQSVPAPEIPPISSGGFPPPAGGTGGVPAPNIVPPVNQPPTLVPPTGGTSGPSNFFYRRPGPDVARALHTVYLIFLVAGLIGSLLYPMFMKRAPRVRRRPLLV